MERPVGDKFKINGCVYVVVEDSECEWENTCGICAFSGLLCRDFEDVLGYCDTTLREDGKGVHFEHFGVDF